MELIYHFILAISIVFIADQPTRGSMQKPFWTCPGGQNYWKERMPHTHDELLQHCGNSDYSLIKMVDTKPLTQHDCLTEFLQYMDNKQLWINEFNGSCLAVEPSSSVPLLRKVVVACDTKLISICKMSEEVSTHGKATPRAMAGGRATTEESTAGTITAIPTASTDHTTELDDITASTERRKVTGSRLTSSDGTTDKNRVTPTDSTTDTSTFDSITTADSTTDKNLVTPTEGTTDKSTFDSITSTEDTTDTNRVTPTNSTTDKSTTDKSGITRSAVGTTKKGMNIAGTSSANITGTPSANITGTPSANITGTPSANITGTPSANITGTPSTNITGTPSANITGTPSANIAGTPSTNITGTPSANITGTPSANIAGTPSANFARTPSANITGTPSANITGTPSANTTGTPSANITGTPSANITGTPSANITGTPSANIAGTPSANITATPSANITGMPMLNTMYSASETTAGTDITSVTSKHGLHSTASVTLTSHRPFENTTVSASEDWQLYNGQKYVAVYIPATFDDSEQHCRIQLKGELASFISLEQYFDMPRVLNLKGQSSYWMAEADNTSSSVCLYLYLYTEGRDTMTSLAHGHCDSDRYSICKQVQDTTSHLLNKEFLNIIQELTVDKKQTATYIRKTTSAADHRRASVAMGTAGGIVIFLISFSIILCDFPRFKAWWTHEHLKCF